MTMNNRRRMLSSFVLLFMAVAVKAENFAINLAHAAEQRTEHFVIYNGAYFNIEYPNGDVPEPFGVCTDVVIRSYRALGIDLQQLVHEDMKAHFNHYPAKRIWGQARPDSNIDHRRVPNLQSFFSRFGESIPVSQNPAAYQPGDLVTWMLRGNLPHIGIVTTKRSKDGKRPLISHNIGRGPKMDDMLFAYPITGHYRFDPQQTTLE